MFVINKFPGFPSFLLSFFQAKWKMDAFLQNIKKGEPLQMLSFWHPFLLSQKENKERAITWNVFSSFGVGFKCIDVHLELMFYRLVSRSILLQRLKVAFTGKKDPLGPRHNNSQLWKRSKKRVNFSLSPLLSQLFCWIFLCFCSLCLYRKESWQDCHLGFIQLILWNLALIKTYSWQKLE